MKKKNEQSLKKNIHTHAREHKFDPEKTSVRARERAHNH